MEEAPADRTVGRVEQFEREMVQKLAGGTPPGCPQGDFLSAWIANPGPEFCGRWQTQYKELHSQIRGGSHANPKYLMLEDPNRMPSWFPRPGLGDYLVGMASAFLAALLTDRAFVVEPSGLTDVVETAEVDWRAGEDVPHDDSSVEVTYFNGRPGQTWRNAVSFPSDVWEHFRAMDAASNIRVGTNGGVLSRIFANTTSQTYLRLHALGLRLPHAFGCIIRFLFRPKASVVDTVRSYVHVLRQPRMGSVGIHMRTTDTFAWKGKGFKLNEMYSYMNMTLLKCAKATSDFSIPGGYNVTWLFLSDAAVLRKKVREEYGDLVMESPVDPAHPRFQGKGVMASILAEWLLLSTCQNFVITESGFAKTAVAYNLLQPRVFLLGHFKFSGTKGSCDQAKPTSLFEFSQWSGL